MSDSRVFGTPTEPLFNHRVCGVTSEMLQDWMTLLSNKNAKSVETAHPQVGVAISCTHGVEFLFLTCERLRMSDEVKYLSLELFDRFMLQHLPDLHDHVTKSSELKNRTKDWLEIMKRVSNQVVLRIVSCVQIASKLTSHYRVLSPSKARRFLLESGHKYNTESILQSELRILKTLKFCVSLPSPLVYLEAILEVLGRSDLSCEVKVLHGVSLKLLDMVYLRYKDIYTRLHDVVLNGSPIADKDRDSFTCVRTDKMLLMVTLITAAAYIIDRDTHKEVMLSLSKITKIPADDIADFTSVVLQVTMEASED